MLKAIQTSKKERKKELMFSKIKSFIKRKQIKSKEKQTKRIPITFHAF